MITSPPRISLKKRRHFLCAPTWKYAETDRGCLKVGQMFIGEVRGEVGVGRWGWGWGGAAADRRCSSLGSEGKYFRKDARGRGGVVGGGGGFGVLCCRSVGRWGWAGGWRGSCVPAHPVCALQGQGLGLVWGGRTWGAAEGGAVGGRGVTGGVRVLSVEL